MSAAAAVCTFEATAIIALRTETVAFSGFPISPSLVSQDRSGPKIPFRFDAITRPRVGELAERHNMLEQGPLEDEFAQFAPGHFPVCALVDR